MYTIKMNSDKSLVTTVKATLMQKENNVDKIQFLLPKTYEEHDLTEYIVTLIWLDTNDNRHTELLESDLVTYEDYIRCVFNVTRDFLAQAGNIDVKLALSLPENDEVLYTNSTTVTVYKPDAMDNSDYETIDAMRKKIAELDGAMPTDLEIDGEDNLHLIHDTEKIGEGVVIREG